MNQNYLESSLLKQTAGHHLRVSDSIDLEWCLTICISNKFSNDTYAAGKEHTLGTPDPESDKLRVEVFLHHFIMLLNRGLALSESS